MSDASLRALIEAANLWTAGPSDSAPTGVVAALQDAWVDLDGGEDSSMAPYKISGDRVESLEWRPPVLCFQIERHGSMVLGSTYASIQQWTVDTAAGTASVSEIRSRQVVSRAPSKKMDPLAERFVQAVLDGADDPRVRRYQDGRVGPNMQILVPNEGPKQTVAGRRRRLRKLIGATLATHGYVNSSNHSWRVKAK